MNGNMNGGRSGNRKLEKEGAPEEKREGFMLGAEAGKGYSRYLGVAYFDSE